MGVVISSVDNQNNIGDHTDYEKDETQKTQQINDFLSILYGNYYPDTVCVVLDGQNYHEIKDELNEMYQFYTMNKDNNVMAYVCKQFSCQKPTNDQNEFKSQLSDNNDENDENEG